MKMAKQNLTSVKNFFDDTFAHDQVFQQIKKQRHIGPQAAITAFMLLGAERLEAKGVYANFEFEVGNDESLVAVYVGLYGAGIVAAYYVYSDEWHECQSHGNFGKNYASGGTWTTTTKHKARAKYTPQIIEQIIKGF